MSETLLDKAKQYGLARKASSLVKEITDEHIDLALAWLKDEISPSGVIFALGGKLDQGNYQRHLSKILKEAYKQGKLKVN